MISSKDIEGLWEDLIRDQVDAGMTALLAARERLETLNRELGRVQVRAAKLPTEMLMHSGDFPALLGNLEKAQRECAALTLETSRIWRNYLMPGCLPTTRR